MELQTENILKSFENQISELQSQHQILTALTEKYNSLLSEHSKAIHKALRKGGIIANQDNITMRITQTGDFNNTKFTQDSKLVISIRGEMTGWLKPCPYNWSYSDKNAKKRSQKSAKVVKLIKENLPFDASVSCNEFSLELSRNQESTHPMIDIFVK